MIEQLIAEATECDFKVAVEKKKPKSWLKSVSAFSNGIGGILLFGVDDGRNIIGLSDVQSDAEAISRLIKERITPLPAVCAAPLSEGWERPFGAGSTRWPQHTVLLQGGRCDGSVCPCWQRERDRPRLYRK